MPRGNNDTSYYDSLIAVLILNHTHKQIENSTLSFGILHVCSFVGLHIVDIIYLFIFLWHMSNTQLIFENCLFFCPSQNHRQLRSKDRERETESKDLNSSFALWCVFFFFDKIDVRRSHWLNQKKTWDVRFSIFFLFASLCISQNTKCRIINAFRVNYPEY